MDINGKKIVAVDDSVIILKMIEKLLEKEYSLQLFKTGLDALVFLKNKDRAPDLIILDIEMPQMNGYELLEKIKEMEHLKDVPVIFLTSNNEKRHVVKAVAGGAKDYVVKPFDRDILLDKIHSLLNNSQ